MSEKDAPNQGAADPSDPGSGQASDRSSDPVSDRSQAEASATSNGQSTDPGRADSTPVSGSGQPAVDDRGHSQGSASKPAGRGLALVALVLALVALVGVGWLNYRGLTGPDPGQDQGAAAIAELQVDLDALREQMAEVVAGRDRIGDEWSESNRAVSERLAAIESDQARMQQRLDATESTRLDNDEIAAALSRQTDTLQTLQGRVDEIEQGQGDLAATVTAVESRLGGMARSVQEQQGIQREVDRDLALKLDLLEIAALVSIGQARLELGGDRNAALAAYQQARRQLTAINDPRLNQVDERLADEIALIESRIDPDWAGFAARLAQWESQVAEWPLRAETGAGSSPAEESTGQQDSGWLSTVRQSLGQLVSVERRDGLGLDEDMVVPIREQLRLHLAAASLAVQRRDTATLKLRLDHVGALVDEFFRADIQPLVSIRAELATMASIQPPVSPEGLGQAAAALDRVIEAL